MTILDDIVARVKKDLQWRQQQIPCEKLQAVIDKQQLEPPRDFAAALRKKPGEAPNVIAEIKRASPSKGVIRTQFDVEWLAQELVTGGAAAMSVLTEWHYFCGCPQFLMRARKVVDIPLLRKDFIVSPYQVYEARAMGADAILLIGAVLTPAAYLELRELAESMGLGVLSEAHNQEEIRMLVDNGATVVGVNSRDLRNFAVDIEAAAQFFDLIPDHLVKVGESGVLSTDDMACYDAAGVDACLVGEALMRGASPAAVLRRLRENGMAGLR
jgi:indole-3-glycerol phosphate synthase